MKKILLSTILSGALALSLNAKTLDVSNGKSVSAQGSTSTAVLNYTGGVDINLTTAVNYISGDKITFTIDSGAFSASTYYLNSATAPDKNMTSISKTNTTITFRAPSTGLATGTVFSLCGNADLLSGDVNVTGASLSTAGSTLGITATSVDSTGTTIDQTTNTVNALATSYNQFTNGTVATSANGIIDVNNNRTQFTVADPNKYNDTIGISFENNLTALDSGTRITLNSADKVNVTITASSVAGIQAANVGSTAGTIDSSAKTITFSLAGDTYAANGSHTITVDLNTTGNSTALATRTFTAAAEIALDTESSTAGLVTSGTSAGSWTVNGATIQMINMADNGLGTVSTAMRLINNDSTNAAELYVTPTNRTTQTVCDEFKLADTVPANGSYVLTAAKIMSEGATNGCTISSGDDFSVSVMMTVPQANAEAIVVQRSGTGQRVLGNSTSDLTAGGL